MPQKDYLRYSGGRTGAQSLIKKPERFRSDSCKNALGQVPRPLTASLYLANFCALSTRAAKELALRAAPPMSPPSMFF